jgi:hypothetical protein
LSLVIALVASGSASADANLYQATTFVTGQYEPNRSIGFGKCLEYVLVKVTGDPRLTDDPRVAAMAADAKTYVVDFHYRDLMEGIPVHDEQGTRQRPYDLTVTFDPAKIDAAVRGLGLEPWTGPRPRLVLVVGVRNGIAYMLANGGSRGRDLRDAMAAAGDRIGMPVALPAEAALTKADLTFDTLPGADLAGLDAVAKTTGGDVAVTGTLDWSDKALGWIADWRLTWKGETHHWRVQGVNFDDAFRSAIGGAAQIVSGHGAPD